MIGISATSQPVAGAGTEWVADKLANDPVPIDRPRATNRTSARTLSVARKL